MEKSKLANTLIVDELNPCWSVHGMFYKEFPSDPNLIRYYTVMVISKAPEFMKEKALLEQQVSEVVKNAIYHGNGKDKSKLVKIHYSFNDKMAKLIIEDEGDGFIDLEDWRRFNDERNKAFASNDPALMMEYVSYRTEKSTPDDGGNSLFAAVEYWNKGMIYNLKKNKVCVMRQFEV